MLAYFIGKQSEREGIVWPIHMRTGPAFQFTRVRAIMSRPGTRAAHIRLFPRRSYCCQCFINSLFIKSFAKSQGRIFLTRCAVCYRRLIASDEIINVNFNCRTAVKGQLTSAFSFGQVFKRSNILFKFRLVVESSNQIFVNAWKFKLPLASFPIYWNFNREPKVPIIWLNWTWAWFSHNAPRLVLYDFIIYWKY